MKNPRKKKIKIFQPNFLILYEHIKPAESSKPKLFGVKVEFSGIKVKRKNFSLLATLPLRAVMAHVRACTELNKIQNLSSLDSN